eukprot:4412102-Prymnesium_polylepis.2
MSLLADSGGASAGEGAMVVSMLPNSDHVRAVYTGDAGLLSAPHSPALGPNLTFIDCEPHPTAPATPTPFLAASVARPSHASALRAHPDMFWLRSSPNRRLDDRPGGGA